LNKAAKRAFSSERKTMSLESAVKQNGDYIWQDREIRFDSKPALLQCRKGEQIIGELYGDVDICVVDYENLLPLTYGNLQTPLTV
jgi:hypothetical protein